MKNNLTQKTKTGIIWDLSGAFVRQFAFLFISIILARLLEPEEFGILGMAMVFISLSEVFTDVGFTSGLIQQKNTRDVTYSSVFYVNLLLSLVLSGIILITAPLIAEFYEAPKVKTILFYLSAIPPIAAIGRVQAAILTKNMNFKSLTIRDMAATVVGGLLGVGAAFLDFGVYSLVIQQIAMVTTATVMLWVATSWRPKFEFSMLEIKKLFSYSSFVFLDSVLRQIANKIDIIFIGKVFTPAMLGFYSRAESLKAQVQTYTTNSLRKVIFPVLSALQDDDIIFKQTYFKTFNVVTGLIVILIAPLFFLSDFIIIFLFGQKWEPSVIFFQILIFSAITSPQIGMMAQAVLAKGYSKLKFKIGLVQRVLKLAPIAFGLLYGITEFAIAVVVASTIVFFFYAAVLNKKLQLSFWLQVKNLLVPNLVFFIFMLIHFVFSQHFDAWVASALFLITHIIFIKVIKHESYFFIHNIFKTGISLLKTKFKT